MPNLDGIRTWAAATSDRALLRRSVVTCFIVGAILTAINQGDALVQGAFDSVIAWKVVLNFVVPFLVSTISGAAAINRADKGRPAAGSHD